MTKLSDALSSALDTYQTPQGSRAVYAVDYLYKRGTLPEELYIAACAFRADYEAAIGLSSAPITNWGAFEAMALTDNPDLLGGRHKASQRLTKVPSGPRPVVDARKTITEVRVVVGSLGFQILRAICGLGVPIAAVAQLIGVHRDIVSFRLREALHDAADYYGVGDGQEDDAGKRPGNAG
jgi:hypothetical protein